MLCPGNYLMGKGIMLEILRMSSRISIHIFYKKVGLLEISTRLLKKVRKFSAGFLRPRKVDRSCAFKIQIFTQDNQRCYLICTDFLWYPICQSVTFVWGLSICVAL